MRWLWTLLPGICILLFAFSEVFQDLFHPTQTGSLSDWIGRTSFRVFRHWPSLLSLAGPLTLVLVIFCWAGLQAVGFAFVYWAGFPNGFEFHNARTPQGAGFGSMLYFSVQVMTTLGLGDLLPATTWLRVLVSLQALTGFALLTASVSSIVLIYPALARMRCLARRTETLIQAARRSDVDVVSGNAEYLLGGLAVDVIRTRVDFIHFPVIYYFHSDHRRSSLAHSLPHLLRFAEAGSRPDASDGVRFASAALQTALEDLAHTLSARFIRRDSTDTAAIFRAYAEDHLLVRATH